ncbi:microcephalin-like [Culicoides brevitarsis]|uniref:microcephalin-like n=1 Tax=Culicoides brevitarsis TaxID=469753 RepID=UPI00307B69C5
MTGSQNTPEDPCQDMQEMVICKDKSPSPSRGGDVETPRSEIQKRKMLLQEYRSSPSAMARMKALKMMKEKNNEPDLYRDELDLVTADERAAAEREITLEELFQGICLFVDVRTAEDNRSAGIQQFLKSRGIKVTTDLSEATHIIFKDGLKSTFAKGKELNLPFVSLLWIDACRKFKSLVDYKNYPVFGIEKYEDPILCKKIKRKRSMQPATEFVLRTPKRRRRPKTVKVHVEKPQIEIQTPVRDGNCTIRTPKTIEISVRATSHARVTSSTTKNGETMYYSSDEMEVCNEKHEVFTCPTPLTRKNARRETRMTLEAMAVDTPKSVPKKNDADYERITKNFMESMALETPRRLDFDEIERNETEKQQKTIINAEEIVPETPKQTLTVEDQSMRCQTPLQNEPIIEKPIFTPEKSRFTRTPVHPMTENAPKIVLQELKEVQAFVKGPINSTRYSSALHEVHFDTDDISEIVLEKPPLALRPSQPTPVIAFPDTPSQTTSTKQKKKSKTPVMEQTKHIPKPRRKRKLFNPNLTPQVEVPNDNEPEIVPPTPKLPSPSPVKPSKNVDLTAESATQPPASTQKFTQSSQKPRRRVFVATGLGEEGRRLLKQCVKKLNSKREPCEIQSFVDSRATHLIMQEPYAKTQKLLLSIINGIWVLNLNFVKASLECSQWLCEEPFEVKTFLPGICLSRAEREIFGESYSMRLFSKQKFFVANQLNAGPEEIREFIKLCGGIVVTDTKDATYQVRDELCEEEPFEGQVLATWVTDSIGAGHRKNVKNYLLAKQFSQTLSSQHLIE